MNKLYIFSEVKKFKVSRKKLSKIFKSFLNDKEIGVKLRKNFKSKIAVNLVFVEEDAMKKINELWKGGSGSTDVLTFDYGEKGEGVNGEIYICVKVAERNVKWDLKEGKVLAEKSGLGGELVKKLAGKSGVKELDKNLQKGLAEEIFKLFVHGLLHLCGWTHETPGKYAKMMKKTTLLLMSSS